MAISKRKSGSDTRQRIARQAIILFNRHGVQNVSIDSIASKLSMSPGNLTYHFNRKDDLINATYEILKENVRIVLAQPVEVHTPQDTATILIRVFRTFWAFRFFFNSLAYLLTENQSLRGDYSQFRNWVIDSMESNLCFMAERGVLRQTAAQNSFRLLAENTWGLLLNWLRMQQIESPSASKPQNQAVYSGLLHLWSLIQPWMAPEFADEFLLMVQTQLLHAGRRQ